MENVEKRTMRKCSSASSLNSHNTTHSLRSYNLNRQKALDKKKDSCNKEHIVSEWKANNLVIEFSTSAYELFKTLLQQNLLSSNTFSLKTTEGLDGQNAKIDTCMKVYNRRQGENTIECGQCQEWVHFSCGNISNPLIMNDKEYICPVCSDNLLYASTQTTGISLNEQEQIIDLSSESPQPCVVNRKRSLLDMTLPSSTATDISDGISMGPSPNKQTCPSNNISKDACMQKMPEEAGARSKQKKQQNRQNVKPNRETH
ncbi:Hypothetical predicted protein [Mytilus galloprovincialis]|uniref:Zinc finger PHD-type domain-containing protein n=1 Tax=Mytilus galloprovincialis TaxID=29158 RepID=A0A8B6D0H2_MYTGA|nr:Hypothetical predicted protein [Mytilus galloprovincialis]